jgi:lambda family phage portal protein
LNLLDKAISWISPKRGFDRLLNRERAKFLADDSSTGTGSYYGPYAGAMSTRTSTPWFISPTNPAFRYASAVALKSMRNRARTLEKNNEIAEALLSRSVENIVGPKGFQLQVTANNPAWTKAKNVAWRTQAKKLMETWFPSADISGIGWVEHQKTVMRSALRDGDVGVVLDKDGFLQGIESDLITDPDKKTDQSGNILFGVETDAYGKPTAFWINVLPASDDQTDKGQPKSVRVAAKDFIFVALRQRFGQIRGVTIYSTIFELLDQIAGWKIATLMAARIAACFGLAITKKDKSRLWGNNAANAAGQTQAQVNIEPGMVQYLDDGDTITPINPANPGHNFPQNLTAMVRLAGLPFGMPLELVLLDFSKTSYASCRAAMLQAYRKFQGWQQFFIDSYLKRVYQWRISKFIKAGLLEENPDAFSHKWIAQPWPFLDPIKELQAIQMAMDTNMDTLEDLLQAHGKDIDVQITRRALELKKLAAAGIPVLHSQALMQYVNPTSAMKDPNAPAPTPSPADPSDSIDEEDDDEIPDDPDADPEDVDDD